MAKGSGKTTFIVFIMFMMCLSSIVAAGGLYITSKDEVDASNLEIRSEASNIAVLPRPGNIVGRYNATSLKGNKWNDLSGKGNHITSEKIKGTLSKGEGFKGEYVKGTKDDGFTLPQKFENNHWSFFAVARYGSEENQERIFVSGDTEKIKVGDDEKVRNWLIGHHGKKTGVAHYNNWVTNKDESVHGIRPWIRMVAQHNYFATNGISRSTDFSFDKDDQEHFNNPKSIGINVGNNINYESSDWNVYEILVYDTYLDGVDREKVDNYLKEKYILANLKSGISLTGGRPKITNDVKLSVDSDKNAEPWYGGEPRFGTQEDCRRFAQELGYPQWGHYNEKHSDQAKRNTCFFYGENIVEIKPEDQEVDGKGIEDMTFGCTQPYRNPKMNCEAGSGTGSNTTGGVAATASGAYCKAKKKLSERIGLDWVQANVCSKHCTKDACMKPTETFFDQSGAGTSYKLTDYCTWDRTPDFVEFYNSLIKDVATHPNADMPNKDKDGNAIDYLGKHINKCKTTNPFKLSGKVEGVRYVWFGFAAGANPYLNLSEIEIYSGGVNIVKDWDGSQVEVASPHYQHDTDPTTYHPKNLFDGRKADTFYHSGQDFKNFVKIDLGKEYTIERVNVVNREHCGDADPDANKLDGWCNNRWEGSVLKLIGSDGKPIKFGEFINSTDTSRGSKTYLF